MRQFLFYDFQKLKALVSGLAKFAGDVFLRANCPHDNGTQFMEGT